MEKHIAVVHVGAPDEERNTRKFLTNLSFNNVRQINTVEFTCLLNKTEYDNYSNEPVKKEEFMRAIERYLKLSDDEQVQILKNCCTFVEIEEPSYTKFELPQQKYIFDNIEDELKYEREIQILESRLKHCKNHLERQQINRDLQNLKWKNSKHQKSKVKHKRK